MTTEMLRVIAQAPDTFFFHVAHVVSVVGLLWMGSTCLVHFFQHAYQRPYRADHFSFAAAIVFYELAWFAASK